MKKALCVLIHHNLVIYRVHKRSVVEYEAQCSRVLRMLRYPRYIYTTKTLYSDTGELIVEELLLNGKMTMSAVVKKVADRLTETMEGQYWVYSSERKPRLAGSAVLLGLLTCLFPLSYRWQDHGLRRGIKCVCATGRYSLCTALSSGSCP